MKKSLLCRLVTAGTALLLSSLTVFPGFAANVCGHLDTVDDTAITGWAWNAEAPEEAVSVEITISCGEGPGANTLVTVPALLPREDLGAVLGSGNHAFSYEIDWTKIPGDAFTVTAAAVYGEEKISLIGSYTYNKKESVIEGTAGGPGASKLVESAEKESPSNVPQVTEAGEYLGEFKATGYCSCEKCSGGYAKTYSGTIPQAKHTIAADLDVFPLGTKLVIDGVVYTVEDMGGGVDGNRLDIYFATHEDALDFGLQTVKVYAPK